MFSCIFAGIAHLFIVSKVLIQILQTLSILCQSVRNTTSMYYLLSNNYVNEIIGYSYDFECDELVDTFISFMKSLSLRLNTQTVQFFFIEETGAYPLLSKAISFLSFKEPMVRTAAQATILNVYRISEVRAREYALQDRIVDTLLSTITSVLNSQYKSMCDACFGYRASQPDAVSAAQLAEMGFQRIQSMPSSQGSSLNYERQLDSAIVGFEDWMYYLQDLMDLKIPRLTRALIFRLVEDFVQTTLLGPIEICGIAVTSAAKMSSCKVPMDLCTKADISPQNLTQVSLSLFIICQMFRVITSPELHRAVMVSMLHPICLSSRQRRIRKLLHADAKEVEKSLTGKLLTLGLDSLNKKDDNELRMSIERHHPELLQKREQQIAGVSSKLRTSSTSSSNLSKMLLNEIAAEISDESSPSPAFSKYLNDISTCETSLEVSGHELNYCRRGFELFFSNDRFSCDDSAMAENSAEEIRCSMLACLALQSLCSSLLALTERSRYDDITNAAADEEQLTTSAFYIYSHLFQSMTLWPVLSCDGELYPPSAAYWDRSLYQKNVLPSDNKNSEECAPSDLLEFANNDTSCDPDIDLDSVDVEAIVGVKLDMLNETRNGSAQTAVVVTRTKPSDFDVSLELVFSASESCPNPFTSEPGVSIGAGKRLSMDGAALRPGQDEDLMPPGFHQEFHSCANDGVPTLAKKLCGIDWVDPNIVPVPILDALFEEHSKRGETWTFDTEPNTIPVFLCSLLATERASKSLPLMQVICCWPEVVFV